MGMMRSAGHALHGLFAWNNTLADVYLRLWRLLLAHLPEGRALTHLRNNLLTMDWPDLDLKPIRVPFVGGLDVQLIPRPQTLAFSRGMFYPEFAHEPGVFHFLQDRMQQYDCVVEVGANIGTYTVFFSRALAARPDAQVLSYEPARRAFADLQAHLALNQCGNVTAFNCAVSPGPKHVAFFDNPRDWTKGSVDRTAATWFRNAAEPTLVRNVTGADILPLVGDRTRLLLKVDVVGAEAIVLTALQDLIREKRPDMILGVWQMNLPSLNELGFLRDAYDLWRIDDTGLVPRDAFVDDAYCNYFLRPREN